MIATSYAQFVHYEPIVIHTGRSVIVRGHLISLERDEINKITTVQVKVMSGHVVDGTELEEVKRAASLFASRSKRFLGAGWVVVPWSPPSEEKEWGVREGSGF